MEGIERNNTERKEPCIILLSMPMSKTRVEPALLARSLAISKVSKG